MIGTGGTHLSKPIKGTTPRVNPNVNDGLRVIMTCQCKFIGCGKRPALGRGVDKGVAHWLGLHLSMQGLCEFDPPWAN